jgi:hypothetical protein
MGIFKMTVKTETASGTKVQRTTCYGADSVSQERAHYRSLAPAGSTQTITVEEQKR